MYWSDIEDKVFVILMAMLTLSVVVLVGIAVYVTIEDGNKPVTKSHCTCVIVGDP